MKNVDDAKTQGPTVAFESLAPKVLRDKARSAGWPEAKVARLNSYYFALLQVIQLRGEGSTLYNGLIREFSGIRESDQKPLREFLEKIGLLKVESQRQNGGRISHRYRLLRVPYQSYSPDVAQREREERATQAECDGSSAGGDPVGQDVEVDEDGSSEVSTNVDTSSDHASAKSERPSDDALLGSDATSVMRWSKDQLLTEIREHPYAPSLERVSHLDVLARAVELIPGSAGFIAEVGGWSKLLPELDSCLVDCDGSVLPFDYEYLVRAALDLERMPYEADGAARVGSLASRLLTGMLDLKPMAPFESRPNAANSLFSEDAVEEETLNSLPL